MPSLMSLCHEAGNGGTIEGVALNMHAPYFYNTNPINFMKQLLVKGPSEK